MKKILLIEDNKEVRENTAKIPELASYDAFTAKNGNDTTSTSAFRAKTWRAWLVPLPKPPYAP